MTSSFDPMEYRIREAEEAVTDDWHAATVDQRIYALAGWFCRKVEAIPLGSCPYTHNGNGRSRAKQIVVNIGYPAAGTLAVLKILEEVAQLFQ